MNPSLQIEQRGEEEAEHLVERAAHRVPVDEGGLQDVEGDSVVAERVLHLQDLGERVEELEERQEVAEEVVRDPALDGRRPGQLFEVVALEIVPLRVRDYH